MAMVEFLKYWWYCISIGWRFGYGVFSLIAGVCLLVSTGLFWHKKYYQYKWKQWKQIIMKTAFYLFVISFFVATFLVAPFLQYRENKIIPINTKQEIRTLLESINPEILQMIDVGQKEISVLISVPKQMKLSDLSKRPDFNKFFSFEQGGDIDISTGGSQKRGFIDDLSQTGYKNGYYFYPKDALIK